ncbi:hypothetical protein FQR65_LT07707 [Abscondita terminalis]|nr:hypothetical protein FQR65_LT07707 [Abscondita terminalis]
MNDNLTQQNDEIEALHAIYGTEWRREPDIDNSYYIQITPDVQLSVTLNSDYPSTKPPNYQLLAPTLKPEQKSNITKGFEEIYKINFGGPVLFQWIEKVKEIVGENVDEHVQDEVEEEVNETPIVPEERHNYNIIHGPVIQDRKSVFQGHVCKIYSHQERSVGPPDDEQKDISSNSQHPRLQNYSSQRNAVTGSTGYMTETPVTFINRQDCDDDGENQAGGRLLHFLQIVDVTNVLVVVSRWYGGIPLGPDRFRHINNAARQVLVQTGFITKKT